MVLSLSMPRPIKTCVECGAKTRRFFCRNCAPRKISSDGIERIRQAKTIRDQTRVCRDCGKEKNIEEFRYNRDLYWRCAPCRRRRNTESVKSGKPYKKWVERLRTKEGRAWGMLQNAKSRARRYGTSLSIGVEDISIPKYCPLLGIRLNLGNRSCRPDSPTLDCIIPSLGYVPGNVWVISHRANTIKSDASVEEIDRLVKNLRKRLRQ